MTSGTPTDADLVVACREGDRAAFAAIYDRYCDRLHSYCHSMLRNRDDAADATQDAFVKAAQRLDQLRDPDKLRPWLYAIARNEATNQMRRRARVEAREDAGETLVDDRDPAQELSAREVADLVWAAIDGLTPRDRELADLHLREGLEGEELAGVVGVTDSHLRVLLSRMRDRVERSLGALLVARVGRDDCSRLGGILRDWDGKFSMEIRSQVTRHVESCDVCTQRRSLVLTPMELLPTIMFLPAPAALRETTLTATRSARTPEPGSGWRGSQMVADRGPNRGVGAAVVTGVALLAVVFTGAALAAGSGTELTVAASSTTAAPGAGGPAPVPTPGVLSDTTVAPDQERPIGEEPGTTLPAVGDDEAGASSTTSAVAPTTSSPSTVTTQVPPTTTRPPTTTTEPPTTTRPPATTTQPPTTTTDPPAPPRLTLDRSSLHMGGGSGRSTAQVVLDNDGETAANWQAASGATGFSVSPAQGTLAPGASTTVTVLVDRSGLAEGDTTAAVTFTAGPSQASLQATASTDRAPTLGGAAVDPRVVTPPGGSCAPTQTTARVTVSDESPLQSVVAEWGAEDGQPRSTAMSSGSARGRYTVALGPFRNTRTAHTIRFVAVDSRGNSASASVSLEVITCP